MRVWVKYYSEQLQSLTVRETPQTQTDQDSKRMENPKVLAGFDNWDDIPPDIARFIAKSGAAMEDELNRSDASQVWRKSLKAQNFPRFSFLGKFTCRG